MAESCLRCGAAMEPESRYAVLCSACEPAVHRPAAVDPPEYDHRGVQLPARTRVGGIITPQ